MTWKRTLIIAFVIVAGPPIVVYAFFETLILETGRAFYYAWNEALSNIASMRREFGREIKGGEE